MTEQDKKLLLVDLCARLPYKVQCHIKHIHHLVDWIDEGDVILTGFRKNEFTEETEPLFCNPGGNPKIVFPFDSVKPYLRPMSSMTDEENDDLREKCLLHPYRNGMSYHNMSLIIDWLNSHHFDYRGLIEKGLALEAPADMYNNKDSERYENTIHT